MGKPVDLSKILSSATSKLDGISYGFHDPNVWISTNNYALNYRISGKFSRGIPLGQVAILAGESGSGKSFLAANIMKNALEQGVTVVVFDTENGLTKEWLLNTGIDVEKYKNSFMRYQVATVDSLSKLVSTLMKQIKIEFKEDKPKILFVVDSLSMLSTQTDIDQFDSGNISKGDMGRQAKALKAFVKRCVVEFAEWDIGMVCTNHTYASQNMFDPEDSISGGQGPIYAASIVVAMKKLKLKEDEEGNKQVHVSGIKSKIAVRKTRYTKPFENVEIKIPYNSGIDKYSGLVDMFEGDGVLVKDGNKLKYVSLSGEEFKFFRKHFITDEGKKLLNLIMSEYDEIMKSKYSHLYNEDAQLLIEEVQKHEDDIQEENT